MRQTRTRKPFPESLPREENRLKPTEVCCPDCGGALSYLGEDAAEQLGLLVWVLTSKYAGHTPLNRQSDIYVRQVVTLSRSLLSGWVDAYCQLLSPLDKALQRYVLTDGKLHADDTPGRG